VIRRFFKKRLGRQQTCQSLKIFAPATLNQTGEFRRGHRTIRELWRLRTLTSEQSAEKFSETLKGDFHDEVRLPGSS